MKVYYRYCEKCNELKPYLTYFLSKENNKKLTEEERKLYYECYKKLHNTNYYIICANCKNLNILNGEEYNEYNNHLLHCKYCLDFLKT